MNPSEWERISELFERATECPPNERDTFFRSLTDEPPSVIAELRALLETHDQATLQTLDHVLGDAVGEIARDVAVGQSVLPEHIGPYRIVREVGRGGMGVVYLAQRDDGQFEQDVALKVVRQGMDTDEVRQRFVFERQVLAKLQHPGIANLLDGGIDEQGRPYFALEYIDGRPLLNYCDEQALSVDQRLRMFMRVCDAVQYAHQALIVHRDLKPSNILVTKSGEPRLLDFGIAKLLETSTMVRDTPLTEVGMSLLTPEYGAPEQLRGDPVTTAADVYALGVILYELLSGRRPYEFDNRSPVAIYEALVKTTPQLPSTSVMREPSTVTNVAQNRGTTAPRLRRRLQGDLDVIAMTAMAKDPGRRYESAGALATDIRNFLDQRAINARAESLSYRISKFFQRHTLAAVSGLVVVATLIGGLSFAAWQGRIASREGAKADAVSTFLVDMLASADPDNAKGNDLTVRELVDAAVLKLDEDDAIADPEVEATLRGTLGSTLRGIGRYEEAATQYQRAVTLTKSGADHIQMKSDLGATYFDAGQLDEAQAVYQEVLDASASELGDAHPVSQQAKLRYAGIHFRRGDLAAAEVLLKDVVSARIQSLGPDHIDTLTAQSNLATTVAQLGRNEEAAPILRDVVERFVRLRGERDRRSLFAMSNLGNSEAALGNLDKALEWNSRTVAIRRELLEVDHPELLADMVRLAGVYHQMDRQNEAQALFEEVIPLSEKRLGKDNAWTLLAIGNYAALRADMGQTQEAITTLRRVVAGISEQLGSEHPWTLGFQEELDERLASVRSDDTESVTED